jgi:hypothetical protein
MPSISIKVIYQFQSRSVKSFPYIPYIPQYRGTHKAVHAARPVVRQPEAQLSGCVRQPERKSLPAGPILPTAKVDRFTVSPCSRPTSYPPGCHHSPAIKTRPSDR